jgi:activating signal cointegrator 1
VKAISLWQPWAWLVACGAKQVETRSWGTNYRGPIAIQAAKRPIGPEMLEILRGPDWTHWAQVAREQGRPVDDANRMIGFGGLPKGCIVAIANLAAVVQIESCGDVPRSEREQAFGEYSRGRFAWHLAYVRVLPTPIECRGQQGLWELDSGLAQRAFDEAMRLPNGGAA